jgi:pimeloyl-ACP methyl ester carboxylesterase
MKRGYVDTPAGQVHFYEEGSGGMPLVLLHHTPRSATMYRHMLPMLGAARRVVALDTLGFGNSDPPASMETISLHGFAENVLDALDGLGIERADVLGAMTGSRVALHLGATRPDRVRRLALLGFPFFDSVAAKDARLAETARFELGYREPDGAHIVRIWRYAVTQLAGRGADHSASGADPDAWRADPSGGRSPIASMSSRQLDYLEDWVVDGIKAGEMWTRTALAVYKDDPVPELSALRIPTLVIGLNGAGFPAYLKERSAKAVGDLVPGARFVLLEPPDADSRVSYLYPEELSRILLEFLDDPTEP